ncbi:peroxide stress protein YaaA [Streptococcus saliviloxodontae]|uniref:UPF0246 protein JOC31_001845 n=1 Tax=Streptococcus saliviloxodontae TaxID=1349416 RepID=A0ABS2PNQ9_9STRE|nr:peroxide stress protein YaaA [Streptococcus saliviloxodontae]MBM7637016.1 cytoplasmic iron level regulating protein YaaA (DUF328/UPF0246 family) [Streptococcus saliviloxodontae]
MLTFLIPTAKEMKIPNESYPHALTSKSSAIIQEMSQMSPEELGKCYKIKEDAAQKEFGRIQAIHNNTAPAYPAIDLFNGLMYRYIKKELSTSEQLYLNQSVFITSSLYGIIPANFPIAEHRLDFHTKIKVQNQSLKNYWRKDYDNFVAEKEQIVSLLSSEFEEVFSAEIRQQFLKIKFMEDKDGQLKTHSTISKKARGAFLTAVVEHNIQSIETLKDLQFDGFYFLEDLSIDDQFVYIKKV